jgi:hypothetical protein
MFARVARIRARPSGCSRDFAATTEPPAQLERFHRAYREQAAHQSPASLKSLHSHELAPAAERAVMR